MLKKVMTTILVALFGSLILGTPVFADSLPIDGWVQSGVNWYYYNSGTMLKGGWVKDSKGWTYLSPKDGAWMQQGWVRDSKGWCYIKKGYWLDHASWELDSKGWQFIGADGYWNSSVPSQLINPVDDASMSVARAELSMLPDDIQAAATKVNSLRDELPEKSQLSKRVSAINVGNEEYNNLFELSTIEASILANNPIVKANDSTMSSLELSQLGTNDKIAALSNSITKIDATIADTTAAKEDLLNHKLDNSTPVNVSVNTIIDNIAAIYDSNIDTLNASKVDIVNNQIPALQSQQNDSGNTFVKTQAQINMANAQIMKSAEMLIVSYGSLELEKRKVDENILSLQRNIDMMKLYKDQGMAIDSDLSKLQVNMDSLMNTKNNIIFQEENIKMQLNLLIGRPFNDTAKVVFDPSLIDDMELTGINSDTNITTARDKSYNILIQNCEVTAADNTRSRAAAAYGTNSNEYKSADYAYYSAELKYDDVVRNEKMKFNQACLNVTEGQNAVDLENSKLAQEKINLDTANYKYNLGIISKKSWQDEVTAYNLQDLAVESAKQDLYTKYQNVQWMLKGLSN